MISCRWFGTNLGQKDGSAGNKRAIDSTLVGRYIQPTNGSGSATMPPDETDDLPAPPVKKSKRQGAGFGNFEGW